MSDELDETRLAIHRELRSLFTPDQALAWLSAPQPQLDHRIPARMMATGEATKVLQLLKAINDGAYL